MGMERESAWDHVISNLPRLPMRDGLYVAAESATHTFDSPEFQTSHPCILAPMGMLDGALVNPDVMKKTLKRVMQSWDGNDCGSAQ